MLNSYFFFTNLSMLVQILGLLSKLFKSITSAIACTNQQKKDETVRVHEDGVAPFIVPRHLRVVLQFFSTLKASLNIVIYLYCLEDGFRF